MGQNLDLATNNNKGRSFDNYKGPKAMWGDDDDESDDDMGQRENVLNFDDDEDDDEVEMIQGGDLSWFDNDDLNFDFEQSIDFEPSNDDLNSFLMTSMML